jgi:HTH-type transcriptional regulator/antitoxin HipB
MIDYVIRHPRQLSSILKALRKRAGMSQLDVATRLGVSHQAISALEKQPEKATIERLIRLLSVLKVEIALRNAQSGKAANLEAEW